MMTESEGDSQEHLALIDAYGGLTAGLNSPGLVEHLLSSRLLTQVEYDCVRTKTTSVDKNSELLDALRRKRSGCIVEFCQLLFSHDQSNCGDILLSALRARGVDVSKVRIPQPIPPPIPHITPKYYPLVKDLQFSFISLVQEVLEVGSAARNLKFVCIQLLNDVTSTKRNVQEDIDRLKLSCDSRDCIMHLQPYWDCLDCDLLYSLVRVLKDPHLLAQWKEYQAEVKEACRATLEEARGRLPDQQLASSQISVAFQTSLTPRNATIQKILDLREFLQKVMGLTEADFKGFANPTVTLFFALARIRLPFLIRLLARHRSFLKQYHIMVVFAVGEFIYDVIVDQEFPYPMDPQISRAPSEPELLTRLDGIKASLDSLKESRYDVLQDKLKSCELKLKEEEMAKKKALEYSMLVRKEKQDLIEERKELLQKVYDITEKFIEASKRQTESSLAARKLGVPQDAFMSALQSLVGTENPASLQEKLKMLLEERSEWQPIESTQAGLQTAILSKLDSIREDMVKDVRDVVAANLQDMLSKDLNPPGSFVQEIYSKVFIPQMEQQKKANIVMMDIFEYNQTKVFQADQSANLSSMHIPNLLHPSQSYKAVLIGRNIFITSGGAESLAQVQVYSVDSGKWLSLPEAPQHRSGIAAVRGSLVLFGGRENSTMKPTSLVSTWVDAEGRWSFVLPPMTEERVLPGILVLGSRVFVLGGRRDHPGASSSSHFCEVLDLDANQWRSCSEVPAIPCEDISVGLFGEMVVALPRGGGVSYNRSAWAMPVGAFLRSSSSSVDKSSPSSSVKEPVEQSWKMLPAVPSVSAALLTPSSHPVVVGGLEEGDSVHGKVYVYQSGRWCLMGELLTPRAGAAVVGLSSTAFLACGGFTTGSRGSRFSDLSTAELVQFS